MKSKPGALKRIYIAKMEGLPREMSYPEKCSCVDHDMRLEFGPKWKEEMDGEGGLEVSEELEDKIYSATRKEGYHGDDVPPGEGGSGKAEKVKGLVEALMRFLGE
jgi:hypothetical protein